MLEVVGSTKGKGIFRMSSVVVLSWDAGNGAMVGLEALALAASCQEPWCLKQTRVLCRVDNGLKIKRKERMCSTHAIDDV